jgi:hypothetical protein
MRKSLAVLSVVAAAGMMAGCVTNGTAPGKAAAAGKSDAGTGALALGKLVANKDAPIPVPPAAKAITVDGSLSDSAWKNATAVSDFLIGRSQKSQVDTRVLLTYDKDNLYLAVVCAEPNTDKLVATATGPDASVWNDDEVEVYLDAKNEKGLPYFGFFVNPKGVTYDRTRDGNWSGTWTTKTAVTPGQAWVAEFAIPFKTLEVTPAPGHKMGLMVCRLRKAGLDKAQWMYLVPCNEEAKDTKAYPVLELK